MQGVRLTAQSAEKCMWEGDMTWVCSVMCVYVCVRRVPTDWGLAATRRVCVCVYEDVFGHGGLCAACRWPRPAALQVDLQSGCPRDKGRPAGGGATPPRQQRTPRPASGFPPARPRAGALLQRRGTC